MADLRLQFLIEAVDGVKGVAGGIAGGVKGMARDIVGSLGGVTGAMQGFSRSYAGIATAIGGGLELRDIVGDQDTFNRLRVQYGMTGDAIEEFKNKLFEVADAAKVKTSDMLAAVAGFKDAGGDVAKFGDDAKTAAAMVQLLGGQGDDVGRMIAALHKQLNVDDITSSVAALYEQTKTVPGGFGQLASQINPLAAQYAMLGHTGTNAAKELGAVYAVIADGAKNGRQAAFELTQLLDMLKTPEGKAKIGRAVGGIDKVTSDLYDPKNVLPITDIVGSIAEAYKRDPKLTALLLGPQLANDLKTVIAQPGLLDQKLAATGDPGKFFADAAEAAKSLAASLNQLKSSVDAIGDSWLAKPFSLLAGAIGAAHGALAAFIVVLGGLSILGNVVPWFAGGASAVLSFAGTIGLATRALLGLGALNLGVLAEGLGLTADGFLAVGVAIEATPVGWILAGLAAIAVALYGLVQLWKQWHDIRETSAGTVVASSRGGYARSRVPSEAASEAAPTFNTRTAEGRAARSAWQAAQAAPRAPAFGGVSAGDKANNQVNGQVVVRFDNAPANLSIDKAQSDNPNVGFDVDMGYGLVGAP